MAKVFIPSAKGVLEARGEIFGDGEAFSGIVDQDGYTKSKLYGKGKFFLTEAEAIPETIKLIDKKIASVKKASDTQVKKLEELKHNLVA